MLPWARQAKHQFEIYGARAGYNYIPPKWGYVSVCEIDGRPSFISLSLPFVNGRVWSPSRVSFVGRHATF